MSRPAVSLDPSAKGKQGKKGAKDGNSTALGTRDQREKHPQRLNKREVGESQYFTNKARWIMVQILNQRRATPGLPEHYFKGR